jgi:hypothetical protein
MNKNIILLSAATLALVACKSGANKTSTVAVQTAEVAAAAAVAIPFDSLLYVAERYVDKPVKVAGAVTHTCKHSGRRCFIAGADRKVTIRVEAKGKIGGFNRELIGSQIEVEGTLRERRVTAAQIEKMEQSLAQQGEGDATDASSCSAELVNIRKMQAWMKEHHKDYYATYYIDGEDYREM